MKVLKQVLGIDVAKDELVVSLGKLLEDLSIDIREYQVFNNNEKGFRHLLRLRQRLFLLLSQLNLPRYMLKH